MNRAALLSSSGDPFILLLGIKFWKEWWYEEIDKLYINYNNHNKIPDKVVTECLSKLIDPKVVFVFHPNGIGNGPPQVELLKICNEDLILLLEDDFFVFESGVVDNYFKKIESDETDLLGSPRYSAGEVGEAAKRKYNLDYSGIGDKGYAWWPTGFYCKREHLLKTDLDFGSKHYPKGEYFKELDYTFENDDYTDTFTWASIQLRYLGLKSIDIPQYHASPYEIEDKENKVMNWVDGKIPQYIHGGSLSTSWGGYLSGRVPDMTAEISKREIESRVSFWQIASDIVEGFDEFKKEYKQGIENLIVNANLDRDRIKAKYEFYRKLMRI